MRSAIVLVLVLAAVCSSSPAQVASEGIVLAAIEQEEMKSYLKRRITEFIHIYDNKQMFAKWICLGKPSKFYERINHDDLSISVDPSLTAMAEYRTFFQTLVFRTQPKNFVCVVDNRGTSSFLLWHEVIHAISHAHQLGTIKPSRPFRSAPASVAPNKDQDIKSIATADTMIDHFYINWAESCIEATKILVRLEKVMKANGKTKPTGDLKVRTQKRWAMFIETCNFSVFGQVPDKKERKELEDMIGFHFDPAEILNGYLGLGYPMEYFGPFVTDAEVWGYFPEAKHAGTVGLPLNKHKATMDNISASYTKGWGGGLDGGRNCVVTLSLYGSNEISQIVWDAVHKNSAVVSKRKPVPNVGEEAFLYDFGPSNAFRGAAKFWNAHILITDMILVKHKNAPYTLTRRPINWNLAKRIFMNMEKKGFPPVPATVETCLKTLKASP